MTDAVPAESVQPGRAGDIRRRAEQWTAKGRDADLVDLVGLLRSAAQLVIAGSEAVIASRRLTRGQFDVLTALYRAGDGIALTQADLAAAMLITPAGMKKRIDTLVGRGLILRIPDGEDARKVRLQLTPSGIDLVADSLDDFFHAEAEAVSALDGKERDALRALLRRLVGQA